MNNKTGPHGVSEQTLYTWRKNFGTMEVADAKRLKGLEAENARLKKLLAERDLEIEVTKEISAKNGEHGGSQTAGDLVYGRLNRAALRNAIAALPSSTHEEPAKTGNKWVTDEGDAPGQMGRMERGLKQKIPPKSEIFGAQRRNRTADTRIFKRFEGRHKHSE